MCSVLIEGAINGLPNEICEVVPHLNGWIYPKALDWIAIAITRAFLHDEVPLLGQRNDLELLHYKRFLKLYSINI